MKVLHLCFANGNGGAGLGAHRLHKAMLDMGMQSQMLVANKVDRDPHVFTLGEIGLGRSFRRAFRRQRLLKRLYRTKERLAIRSINLPGYDLSSVVNAWDADIVQMHWVGNGFLPVSQLPRFNKPVFWKLPDMWAFSGAEHYREEIEPERHIAGYSSANKPKSFGSGSIDMDQRTWLRKSQHWTDLPLTVVTPSRWLGREAHFSQLFERYDVHVVPNPLDTSLYSPLPTWYRKNLRSDFGLSPDKHLVAFVSMGAEGKRKGFHYLDAVLREHLPAVAGPDQIEFFVLGSDDPGEQVIGGYKIVKLGRIDDQKEYASLLAMGDSCVFPTEIDNLPNVVTECMACGLPVISFDVGGVPDQIDHLETGYIAKAYDAEDLTNGIAWVYGLDDLEQVSARARESAIAFTSEETAVVRYTRLYAAALRRKRQGLDNLRPSSRTGTTANHAPDAMTSDKPVFPQQRSQSPSLNDAAAIAAKPVTGRFHDHVHVHEKDRPGRIIILEPAAVDHEDSSHNAGYLKDLTAAIARHAGPDREICWVTNASGSLINPHGPVIPLFPYSQYDAVRTSNDTRMKDKASGRTFTFETWSNERLGVERSVFDVFSELQEKLAPLSHRDSIFIPMADKLLMEAALLWRLQAQDIDLPSLHIMVMFEKAKWLTGGYPFSELMTRMRNSQLVGKGIYLYTESEAFQSRLQSEFGLEADVMVYPVERTDAVDHLMTFRSPGLKALADDKPHDTLRVAVLGRGRRDKGFALLPGIVTEFNKLYGGATPVEFVIQDGREMDNLGDASRALSKMKNVTLLNEFISNEEFERHQEEADIVLLPYDRDVYKIRGSSIMWRAVALGKPLVVTRRSALVDALTSGNGIAADHSAKAFAAGLVEIASDYRSWHFSALTAASKYWQLESEYFDALSRNAIFHAPMNVAVICEPSDMDAVRRLRNRGQQVVIWWLVRNEDQLKRIEKFRAERVALTHSQGVLEFASVMDGDALNVPEPIELLRRKGVVDRILVADGKILPLVKALEQTGPLDEQPPMLLLEDFLNSDEFSQLRRLSEITSAKSIRKQRASDLHKAIRRGIRWVRKRRKGGK